MTNQNKKHIFYRDSYRRKKLFNIGFFDNLFDNCSYPRLMLEVFVKRQMGERYLTTTVCAIVWFFLIGFPILWTRVQYFYYGLVSPYDYRPEITTVIINSYWSWYGFTVAYSICAWKRLKETRRRPFEFDFSKYSYSLGATAQVIEKLNIPFVKKTNRNLEMIYEPAPFFVLGILFWIIDQPLGILLILSSIMYAISYFLGYNSSKEYVLDQIDEMRKNVAAKKTFSPNDDNVDGDKFNLHKPQRNSSNSKDSEADSSDGFVE
jgi:hypothetical protein